MKMKMGWPESIVAGLFCLLFAACSDSPTPEPGAGSGETSCAGDTTPETGAACSCVGEQWAGTVDGCERLCFCTNSGWQCPGAACSEDAGDTEADSNTSSARLSWQGPALAREVSGNGDGQANPGESWEVVANLAVEGVDAAGATAVVRLSSISPKIEIGTPSSEVTVVPAESTTVTVAFRIAATATAGTAVIDLEAFVPGGFSTVDTSVGVLVVTVAASELRWSNLELTPDGSGDDLLVEAGESWTLSARLANVGDAPAVDVAFGASPSSATLTLRGDLPAAQTLTPGASVTLTFGFDVAIAPTEALPSLQLLATPSGGAPSGVVEEIPLVLPDTLFLRSVGVEEAGGSGDGIAQAGETWLVRAVVENRGLIDVTGLVWSGTNIPNGDGTALTFGSISGEPTIAAESTGDVLFTSTLSEGFARSGRIQVRAQSDIRSTFHGPFALDVVLP
jgi:hypothetical protein